MQNDLLDGLYWTDDSDDGSQPNYLCPTGNETAGRCPVSETDKIILYGNFMIGVPRFVPFFLYPDQTKTNSGLVNVWVEIHQL
jgi:hypothetical protein